MTIKYVQLRTNPSEPGGRPTLISGNPLMTSEQAAKTTIYYTPYKGDLVPIYDGVQWIETVFPELSLALDANSGHTGYHQSGKNFDLFIYNDSGTLRLVSGPAWTSDTVRAIAFEYKNGIRMNAASMTARFGTGAGDTVTVAQDRGTLVGSFRCSADGTTTWELGGLAAGGDEIRLYLSSVYNQVLVSAISRNSTDSWTYNSTTWRAPNGTTTWRASYIQALDENSVSAWYQAGGLAPTAASALVAIGVDSTSAFTGVTGFTNQTALAGSFAAPYQGNPGVGYHFITPLEASSGTSSTFYGDAGAPTLVQFGFGFAGYF